MNYCFPKSERLCSKTLIEKLFSEGKSVYEFPLKAIWISTPLVENSPFQVAINVSKKRFKRAVKRNVLKRRMRESFRLNKHILSNFLLSNNKQIALMILYNDSIISDYQVIDLAMIRIIEKIVSQITKIK